MVQVGCPLGMGIGGPGYTIPDEFDNNLSFDKPKCRNSKCNAVVCLRTSFPAFRPVTHNRLTCSIIPGLRNYS